MYKFLKNILNIYIQHSVVPLLNVNNYGYLWAQCKSITLCSHKCDNLVITTFLDCAQTCIKV